MEITINATENISKGTVARVYHVYQYVRKVNNQWKIVRGTQEQVGLTETITPASPPTTSDSAPSQQALLVIQQYYYDIGHQDYQDAYNLWNNDFQNATPYCQFVLNHVKILDENTTFGDVTPLTDGTYQISVTTRETTEVISQAVTNVYHKTYIVGQENNLWKILRESGS